MNKKYLSLGLGVALVLSLVACGGKQAIQETPKEPDQTVQQSEVVTQPIEVKQEEPISPEPLAEVNNTVTPEETVPVDETEPVEVVDPFTEVNETVYATGTVNIRSSWSLDSEKLGALSKGDSVTRIGVGIEEAEGWSRVILEDGSTAYISNKYLSTEKPVVQQSQSNGSSQAQQQTTVENNQQAQQPSGGMPGLGEDIDLSQYVGQSNIKPREPIQWADETDDFYQMTPEQREQMYEAWGQQRAGS